MPESVIDFVGDTLGAWRELVIDLVRHMKARNREKWGEDDDVRPLSKLGLRQAEMQAGVMAEAGDIVAVYSSPALRCRETMEPLAQRLGLEVRIEPLLAETRLLASLPMGAENPLLARLREAHPEGGRVVACSHGDTIPAFLASLDTEPAPSLPGVLKGFGGWYRVRVEGDSVSIGAHRGAGGVSEGVAGLVWDRWTGIRQRSPSCTGTISMQRRNAMRTL